MLFSYHRTIYLADTDAAGVMYFAQGLKICHEAYETWLSKIGISLAKILEEKQISIPIVHADIDFLRPIICGDTLQINLAIKLVPDNEFIIHYQIFQQEFLNKPVATAQTRHVSIDPQTRKRISLPAQIISEAESLNNHQPDSN